MPSKPFVLVLLLYSFYIAPSRSGLILEQSHPKEALRRGKHITGQLSEVFLTQFLPKVTLKLLCQAHLSFLRFLLKSHMLSVTFTLLLLSNSPLYLPTKCSLILD